MESAATPDHVRGLLNYLKRMGARPSNYMYEPPAGVPLRTGRNEKHVMNVLDGRKVAEQLTLDKQGFAFVKHESKIANFCDSAESSALTIPKSRSW